MARDVSLVEADARTSYYKRYYALHKERIKRRVKTWVEANREKARAYGRKYYEANKEAASKKRKERYQRTRDTSLKQMWNYWLLKHYGISSEQYDRMHRAQGGLCAICKQEEPKHHKGKRIRLSVDHDHQTNRVRELLCGNCNSAIGYLRENPEVARKIIEYLEKHKEPLCIS